MFTRNLPEMIRILLVDKSETSQNLLHDEMIAAGNVTEIDHQTSAGEVLTEIDTIKDDYDVIITAYALGEKSGLELFRELRQHKIEIPIILLAEEGMETIIVEAMNAGLSNYVIQDQDNQYAKLLSAIVINAVSIDRNRRVRKKGEERINRLLDQQTIVNRLALGLGESTDLNKIYDTIYTYISPLMDADVLIVTNFDSELQILQTGYAMIGNAAYQAESFPPVMLNDLDDDALEAAIRDSKSANIPKLDTIRKQVSSGFLNHKNITQPRSGTASLRKISSIVNSALYAPMKIAGQVTGVLQVQSLRKFAYSQDNLDLLCSMANVAAIAIQNASLLAEVSNAHQDLFSAYDNTLEGWARALELRDRGTKGHSDRVVKLTTHLAKQMGFEGEALSNVYRGALLHDIGKMGVPDTILRKTGPLDNSEWEIMRKHPEFAYNMLSPIEYLRPALDIPYAHHERFDGSGYPRGLKGEEIPLSARIFAVVDVWDAMITERPYRKALPKGMVFKHIQQGANSHFDPKVVEVFFNSN